MANCPNKNLDSYKKLVAARGEDMAMYLWDRFQGNVPKEWMINPKQQEFNNKLKDALVSFVKGFNIQVNENADEMLDALNFKSGDVFSAFDTLQKYLALRTDITNKDLALQSANIIYTFLGRKTKLGIELKKNIGEWSKYEEIYNQFADQVEEDSDDIENDNVKFNPFAHKQAIIHFIAEVIENSFGMNIPLDDKRSNLDIDQEYFKKIGYKNIYSENPIERLYAKIYNWIQKHIFKNLPIATYNQDKLVETVLDIVDDVFKKDYTKFIRGIYEKDGVLYKSDGTQLEQKYYDQTLEKDPFAKHIITSLFDNPFIDYKLSGSQVLRKYGRVFRSVDEDLHDIDGVITLNQFRSEKNSDELLHYLRTRGLFLQRENKKKTFKREFENFLNDQNWYINLKEMFPTWQFTEAFIGRDHKRAESVTIQGTVDHPTEIDPKTGKKKKYALDFFLRTDEGNYPEQFDSYWKTWKGIFEAKINMGRTKDLIDLMYFEPFIEDKYKFTNKGFRYFTFTHPLIDIKTGNPIQEEETEFDEIVSVQDQEKDNVHNLIDVLSKNLNVDYEIITPEDAVRLTKNKKNPWNGEKGFFLGNKVYFVKDNFSHELVIHEFSHPLITSVYNENRELFDNLYDKLIQTKEGVELIQETKDAHPELEENSEYFKKELLVRALTKEALTPTKSKSFADFINNILFHIKKMLRKVFGKSIKIEKLSTNTNIKDLAKMLKSESFNVDMSTYEESEFVEYMRDITKFEEDLKNVDYSSISKNQERFFNLTLNQMRRIRANKNYNEIAKFLVDETGRGELAELKATLSHSELDKELDKLYDETQIRNKTIQSFIHGIARLDQIVGKINKHLKTLAQQGDSQEVIKNIFYYDLLVRNWQNFMSETTDRLADGGLNPNSEFGRVIAGVKFTVDQANRQINKIYADNIDGILYDNLSELRENIDKEYSERIEKLVKNGAPERKIKDVQEEWEKLKITREKLHDIITGNAGDTNTFSRYLEAFTNSPNPVVGGFAIFIKNAMNDVDADAQKNANDFLRDLAPLLEKAGYSRSNYVDLMKKITNLETISFVNEKGELDQKEVWSFIDRFKNVSTELVSIKYEMDAAEMNGEKELADELNKKLRKHLRDYFHQPYVPEYYKKEEIYDSELGKEAYRKKHMLLNSIKELDIANYDENFFDEIAEQKKLLWREYAQLASLTDSKGNPKTGRELELAKLERQYRKESQKFTEWLPIQGLFENTLKRVEQSFVDEGLSPDSEEFIEARRKWIVNNTVIAYTPEFYQERNKILSRIKEIMAELPEDIRKIVDSTVEMEEMLDIATGFRDSDGQIIGNEMSLKSRMIVKQLQEDIISKKEELAGLSGLSKYEMQKLQYYYDLISDKKRLSDFQQKDFIELNERKTTRGLSKEKKSELNLLYTKLTMLQSKEATDYYVDAINSHFARLGLDPVDGVSANDLSKPEVYVDILSNADQEFKDWFDLNHLRKIVYDKQKDEEVVYYERLFVWNKVTPNDPKHYETINLTDGTVILGKPNLSFYYRSVKDEYRTKRIVGKTVDNKGNWLPKTIEEGAIDDKYYNPKYDVLKNNDPQKFAVLEKMKEYHLKFQESAPRESKLYYQIPRYEKPNIELIKSKAAKNKFREWYLNLRKMFFKANDDYESGLNFNPATLVHTDMFDEEIRRVPVTGIYNLEPDEVSLNVGDSMLRYMRSVIKQRKLIDMNPIAQALKNTLESPDNFVKSPTNLSKWEWVKHKLAVPIKEGQASVVSEAITAMVEKHFQGINQKKFILGRSPIALKIIGNIQGFASLGYFALNILPSAVKNRAGAITQINIKAAGGKFLNPVSYMRGKARAFKMLSVYSSELYKTDMKSLDFQLIQLFDPTQEIFSRSIGDHGASKFGGLFGRSIAADATSMGFLMSTRKWLEVEATMELFCGMLYHATVKQTIDGETNEIPYIEAWEVKDGQIQLKEGIDPEYAPKGKKFNAIKNRVHELSNRVQGTFSDVDQPDLQRYAEFRIISFLKKYFTSMLMNRVASTRPSAALGTVSTGTYMSVLKSIKGFYRYGLANINHMTDEEKMNFVETSFEFVQRFAVIMLLKHYFDFDDDDDQKYEKMRARSGSLIDNNFDASGWLKNHMAVVTLGTLTEMEQFISPKQVKKIPDMFTPSAITGLAVKTPMDFIDHLYGFVSNNRRDFYSKDSGPFLWQQKGSPKFYNDIGKMFGITGSQVDPVKSMKGIEFIRR